MTPLPDRLIGHDNSPLGEEILCVSEAQSEAMVRPDRIADDLGRENDRRNNEIETSSWHQPFSSPPKLTMPTPTRRQGAYPEKFSGVAFRMVTKHNLLSDPLRFSFSHLLRVGVDARGRKRS
jgi:hypothetical protein